jgi:tetratricopeptide (TPR) repeat protein
MRKNNLNKSNDGNDKVVAGKHAKPSIQSKKANSGRRTRSDGSAVRRIWERNSAWTKVLDQNPELNAMLERGIQLRLDGRFHEAIKVLKATVQRFPDQVPALWYLGSVYLHDLDQAANALPFFRKGARLSPRSRRASVGLFHALWNVGRQREALRELTRFQSVGHCGDYVKILAEVRKKAPELLSKSVKPKAS